MIEQHLFVDVPYLQFLHAKVGLSFPQLAGDQLLLELLDLIFGVRLQLPVHL